MTHLVQATQRPPCPPPLLAIELSPAISASQSAVLDFLGLMALTETIKHGQGERSELLDRHNPHSLWYGVCRPE